MKFYIQDDFLLDVSSVAFVGESQVILHGGGVINISRSWAPAIRRQVRGYAELIRDYERSRKETGEFVARVQLEILESISVKIAEFFDTQNKLKASGFIESVVANG